MAAQGIPDAISFNEDQVTSIPTLTVQSTNLMANFDTSRYPPSIQILIEGLKYSVLFNAFTIVKSIPLRLVSLAFSTAIYLKNEEAVQFEVDGGKKFSIKKSSFTRLLGFPVEGVFVTPTAEEMVEMFNHMGYSPPLTRISQFKKSKLPVIWNIFFTFFKRCLTGRKGGQDSASQLFLQSLYGVYYDVQVDFGSILWYEFVESLKISTKDVELSSHRFWSVILESIYREKIINYNADEEPQLVSLSLSIPSKLFEQVDLSVVGNFPEALLHRIPATSTILLDYRSPVIKSIPIIQDQIVPVKQRTKKRKEQMTNVSPIKPTKPLKKGDDVQEESSNQSTLKRLLKKPKSHTPKFETIKRSKQRRQILTADPDDDILPISQVFSIAPLINVIEPIAEEPEADIGNEEDIEVEVQHMEVVTDKVETKVVSTTAENEEVMEDEDARIETETVYDVEKEVLVTKVGEETELVDSAVEKQDVLLVENEQVSTEIEKEAVVNADVEKEATITEVETEEENGQNVYDIINTVVQSVNQHAPEFVNDDVEMEIMEPSTATFVSESIRTAETESSIFKDLTHLYVSIPLDSPQIPPVTEKAPILENLDDESYFALSEDEVFELAPIPDNDDEGDSNDDQFISMKQFKILNHKLNMLIRYQDLPKEKEIQKEAEVESVVLDLHTKIEAQSSVFQKFVTGVDDFKKRSLCEMRDVKNTCAQMKSSIQKLDNSDIKDVCADIQNKIQKLEDVIVNGDVQIKNLRDEVLHLQGQYEYDFQKMMDEARIREEKLQKVVDESLAHIRFLEASIKTYDAKEIAEEYNEKVVKHVEMVQQDFIARLTPLINFVARIPKSKEGTSGVSEPKPFRRMDLPLFKSTAERSLPPYLNPTTTTEPQAIVQQLSYPVVTQQHPEAAIRSLDAAHRLSKGIVIGSSIPLMTTSTIVSTIGEGSSITGSGKGKQVVIELSKEEKRMKEAEGLEKLKQKLSLIRQGESIENLGMIGETKIWTEEMIRNIAFGEGEFFNMSPKESFNVELSHNQQLDLPLLPTLFTVKCFMVKPSLRLLSPKYEDLLIKFYGCVGKLETEVWSLKPIIKVTEIVPCEIFEGVFENMRFTVLRTNSEECIFTMADFPIMNPSDLIKLYNMFRIVEKIEILMITTHLRRLLRAYVEAFAKKDMVVSKEFFTRLCKPNISQSGISKEKDGKIIHNPEWGVVSSAKVKGKFVKSFLRIDEKGLFENEVLESILRRIYQNDDNSVKEKRDVEDHLLWWMAVRKEILEIARLALAS